ncbi:response regulator [Candidatus Thiosymbion oneisti]|uniref:response regulator n=1 Tax=Candidatus Thiosymbion oneisti TaxID=589554 RepID=UPI000B7F013D|nr:response regulator [Candidatus Thiosymbion oneisti]
MKFLIVDDIPESLKPLTSTLRGRDHKITVARDLSVAWRYIEQKKQFDLIVIDIALDRYVEAFAEEQSIIRNGLTTRGHEDLPMSGQALGLRLWHQRNKLQQRYCYTTNHMYLWLPNLDPADPEFSGGEAADHAAVIMDKSSLWQNNVEDKFTAARNEWDTQKWLG